MDPKRQTTSVCLSVWESLKKERNKKKGQRGRVFRREQYVSECQGLPWPRGHTGFSLSPTLSTFSVFLSPSHSTSLSLSHLLCCDLCLTSVITAPTAAAVRFRWGEAQACPITWEERLTSSTAKYSCNFPFSLISLTLALGTYLCDNKTPQRPTAKHQSIVFH